MRYSDLSASHRKKLERHSLLKCPRRRINFVRRVMADCSIDRLSKEWVARARICRWCLMASEI